MSILYIVATELYSMLPQRTVAVRQVKGAYRADIFNCAGFLSFSNNDLHIRLIRQPGAKVRVLVSAWGGVDGANKVTKT